MVEINFEGGVLRELRKSDIPVLTEMTKDEDIMEQYFVDKVIPHRYWRCMFDCLDEHRKSINTPRERYDLPIDMEGVIKGLIMIYVEHHKTDSDRDYAEVGYFVSKEYRGDDIAQKCLEVTLPYIHDVLKINKLFAHCLEDNVASQIILRRSGFQLFSNEVTFGKPMNHYELCVNTF